jgi:transcription initiation factor TFIIB
MYNLITCSTCNLGETKMVTDLESGEIICSNCGTVAADYVEDIRKDSNTFSDGKNNERTGPPISLTMHDMGLATQVGKTNRDSSGQLIDVDMRTRMNRLRTWDARIQVRDGSVRNYRAAFTLLNRLKDKLGLPYAVIEKAAYIYRKIQQDGFIKGRMIGSTLAASVYIACRETGVSRTIEEIAETADVRKKTIARAYRDIVLTLGREVPQIDSFQCIEKIGSRVGLPEKVIRHATHLMEKIMKHEFNAGKDPMGMAGAVLYISMQINGLQIKQSDMAAAASVTEVTLRTRAKDLKKKLHLN